MQRTKVIIMGAAGRDFHNFNTFFRDNEQYEVVAFTATQIPDIEGRKYPAELAGKLYPDGIGIYAEDELEGLIKKHQIDEVIFSYSDVPYDYVMSRSAKVNAVGADFKFMGPARTMLESNKPVISVCAVRTGCGKSQFSRKIFEILSKEYRVIAIRHPMPYGDLIKQKCQRFSSYEDLEKNECTIEEREEYEPYVEMGGIVYSGVDYQEILKNAEGEADIIIWDGGNNDYPFYKPDMLMTIVDPHRPGHELRYYPGEMNVRMADIVVISKVNTAEPGNVDLVEANVRKINEKATIIRGNIIITAEKEKEIRGKTVLVIEDGPTVTHGEMSFGAATIKAEELKAKIVDPRPYSVGSIKKVFQQ